MYIQALQKVEFAHQNTHQKEDELRIKCDNLVSELEISQRQRDQGIFLVFL